MTGMRLGHARRSTGTWEASHRQSGFRLMSPAVGEAGRNGAGPLRVTRLIAQPFVLLVTLPVLASTVTFIAWPFLSAFAVKVLPAWCMSRTLL